MILNTCFIKNLRLIPIGYQILINFSHFLMSCQRQSGTGLFKILQRKFRPEKMTLFFLLFISPKRLSQKMPHRPEVRRYAPQVRSVFHFCYAFWHSFSNWQRQTHFFCTFCALQAFFVMRKKSWFSDKFSFSCLATKTFSNQNPDFKQNLIFLATQLNIPRKTYHPARKVVRLFEDLWLSLIQTQCRPHASQLKNTQKYHIILDGGGNSAMIKLENSN